MAKTPWRQILITLALFLGVAITVNWAILQVFGQKSADRATHSLVGIIFLMAYVVRLVHTQETRLGAVAFFIMAVIPCYLGTVFPDLDITVLGIGAHRNPLFHSCLSFLISWFLVRRQHVVLQAVVLGYGVGLASHLFWDVFDYGDVRWLPGGVMDRLWLGANGLGALMPLVTTSRAKH